MSGKPVVSKDQRVGRIKWNNIEVQIHIFTEAKNHRQSNNFGDSAIWQAIKQVKDNQQSCRDFQMVSIHELWVYKAVSRLRINKGLEQSFIKIVLTKDQEKE